MHSVEYRDAEPYVDRDVVAVGCGNSAHDIARSLALGGAKSVTMLQRGPTALLDYNIISPTLSAKYQGQMPLEAADFLDIAIPIAVARLMSLGGMQMMIQAMGDKNKMLEEKGYMIDYAPDMISRAYEERGRAMYMDRPKTFDLVLNDQIKIARGEARGFTESGLAVHDKSTGKDKMLPAGGVVFATGFENRDLPTQRAEDGFFEPEVAEKLVNVNHFGVNAGRRISWIHHLLLSYVSS
jgi:putative flavoprotein involved in K+ transport